MKISILHVTTRDDFDRVYLHSLVQERAVLRGFWGVSSPVFGRDACTEYKGYKYVL